MSPKTYVSWFNVFSASNDNVPSGRKPDLVTERDAIATLLKDGFSLAQASEIWRLLVHAEREGAAQQRAEGPKLPD